MTVRLLSERYIADMGNRRTVAGTATAVVVALVLAGCSVTGSAAPTTASTKATASTSSPTPTRDAVDFGPAPAAAPSCDTILPLDAAQTVVPGAVETERIGMPNVEGSWFAAATVGGLECAAGNGVSPVDDTTLATRDDPTYQGIVVTVLPDAEAAFADYLADVTEGGTVMPACRAADSARLFCNADALAGTAWVSVSSTRLQDTADATPELAGPVVEALLGRVTAAVSASPLARATAPDAQREVAPTACSPTRVNAVTSRPLIDGWGQTDYFRTAGLVALARADSDRCQFASTGESRYDPGAYYSALPKGGWVAQERLAAGSIDRVGRLDLDGLGASDGAWRTCDDTACSVDIVHDGDWTHFVLLRSVAPDTAAAIERWVRSSWKP